MTWGRFGRMTISPSVSRGSSLSSSSKMRTSKYSSLTTPAALGLLRTPGGCHEIRLASVTPYAPLKVSIPNRERRTLVDLDRQRRRPEQPQRRCWPPARPEFGISGRSTSWASR